MEQGGQDNRCPWKPFLGLVNRSQIKLFTTPQSVFSSERHPHKRVCLEALLLRGETPSRYAYWKQKLSMTLLQAEKNTRLTSTRLLRLAHPLIVTHCVPVLNASPVHHRPQPVYRVIGSVESRLLAPFDG
ncbi:hypothetical protein BDM02DRAFT_1756541 [Thelephora ganbajun]|uniref:Uncharacterized protein n=1 Tax=Thelephora ganbajun TaxID=370292 RepID=A0ACB6ZJF5_THEGA|nr:hypothetical protein BDM02DRAFT_1756541 [Thelephora ganbajun]